MGTTVATNALLERKGEPHAAGHHARLSRRAAHRLPEPAAPVRPPHRAARAAVRAVVEAEERVGAHGEVVQPLDEARCARTLQAAFDAGIAAWPSSSCTATATPPRAGGRAHRRARRLHAGQHLARGQPADEAGQRAATPRWSTPTSAPSCAATWTRWPRDAGRAPVLHAVLRRPDRRAPLPGQGRDPLRPGRRHRRHGPHRGGRRARTR
jgi:hypothetical protein